MNRLYAIHDKENPFYKLRCIGEYAREKDTFTIIGIHYSKFNEINELEEELNVLQIPIIRLTFIGDFIEYTIMIKFNKYREKPIFNLNHF